MVVAMAVVRMVQTAPHQIIDMVAVRHRRMTTTGSMRVSGWTGVLRRARIGIHVTHLQPALIEMIAVRCMQTTVVQVVDVRSMTHRQMAATAAVHMRVVAVNCVTRHANPIETDCRRNG